MSNAGRPRKPDNLHLLHGTHDASRHGDKTKTKTRAAKQPKASIPKPPAFISANDTARNEWRRITKALHDLGYIATTDRTLLAQYCWLAADFYDDPEHFGLNAHARLESVQAKLGLTPTMRAKFAAPDGDDEDGDPLA